MNVYLVEHTGAPVYVGKTERTVRQRWAGHKSCKRSRKLSALIRKYPNEVQVTTAVSILKGGSPELLNKLEQRAIEVYKTRWSKENPRGCNLTDGGEGSVGYRHTPLTKKVIQKTSTGRTHKPESIQKLREWNLKREPPSEQTRRKMSISARNRERGALSEETKKLISKAKKKYADADIVAAWLADPTQTITALAESLEVSRTTVRRALVGVRNTYIKPNYVPRQRKVSEEAVQLFFIENPTAMIPDAAASLGVSTSTVSRRLRNV